jgi:hypothetical protein
MRGYIYPVINTNDIDLNTIPDGGALIAINENGQLIKATREGISVIEGVPGPPGKDGRDGRDGLDGINGRDGRDGLDGRSAKGISRSRYDETTGSLVIEYTDGTIENVGNITNDERHNSKFYYGKDAPVGTGTSSIILGSIWYNVETAKTYVYIYDGSSYYWVVMAIPANTYNGLTDSSIEHMTTEDILKLRDMKIGTMVFNKDIEKICQWNGREWVEFN